MKIETKNKFAAIVAAAMQNAKLPELKSVSAPVVAVANLKPAAITKAKTTPAPGPQKSNLSVSASGEITTADVTELQTKNAEKAEGAALDFVQILRYDGLKNTFEGAEFKTWAAVQKSYKEIYKDVDKFVYIDSAVLIVWANGYRENFQIICSPKEGDFNPTNYGFASYVKAKTTKKGLCFTDVKKPEAVELKTAIANALKLIADLPPTAETYKIWADLNEASQAHKK